MKEKDLNIPQEIKDKCKLIIHSASTAAGAAGAGVAQVPVADNAIIVPIQIAMIISLGKVFDQTITKSAAEGIIGSCAASFVGRGLSQILAGWIPGAGNFINTATAAGLTEAIGWRAADRFARMGEQSDKSVKIVKAEVSAEEVSNQSNIDELIMEADRFLNGELTISSNHDEYDKLIKDIEDVMDQLPEDHILRKKYDELVLDLPFK